MENEMTWPLPAIGAEPDPTAALVHGVRHEVISQILRPDVADFIAQDRIMMTSLHDARSCVSTLELRGDPPSSVVKLHEAFPSLTAFDLSSPDDALFVELDSAALPLRSLTVEGCSQKGFFYVSRMAELRSLSMPHCRDLDAGLPYLARLPQLLTLKLEGCGVSAQDLAHIQEMPQLTTLSLRNMNAQGDVNQGFAFVATLPRLRNLDLSGSDAVSAAGIAHLCRLPELRSLNLNMCRHIGAVALSYVAWMRRLEVLDIGVCEDVDAEGLAYISTLPELKTLKVSQCAHLTSEGIESISKLSKLETLDLSVSEHVSSDALALLAAVPNLHVLDLRGRFRHL